jgi:2-polyprenyl-3-methyl-5-hydroxy-6-metoxy-1,4-benzoquinol methylase
MNNKHLFPWWAGYLLINPLRKFSLDPDRILGKYIKKGMTVIDAGCAMGYFSLPAAKIVGSSGLVLCVDMQNRKNFIKFRDELGKQSFEEYRNREDVSDNL